jgi:hypothetical protein
VSTFSFGNGFLAWFLLFPSLFYQRTWTTSGQKKLGVALWVICFVVNEALYFWDYRHPPQHRPLTVLIGGCLEQPSRTVQFFFAFFGAPLVLEVGKPLPAAACVGAVLLTLSLAVGVWLWRVRKDPSFFARALPWLGVGGYGILSGALATVTRSAQFGASEALSSRYGISAVALVIALLHLTPLLAFEALARKGASARTEWTMRTALPAAAASLVIMHCLAFPTGVWDMRSTWQYRVMGKSWLAFIHLIPEQKPITELLYPRYDELKRTATTLQKLGLLQPPPFTAYPTNLFQNAPPVSQDPLGRLEATRRLGQGQIAFGGWAVSPSRTREADGVLLTCEQEGGEPRPFALFNDRVPRADLEVLAGKEPFFYAGWQAVSSLTNLPKGLLVVKAWVYDPERQAVWPLDGAVTVDNR